MKKIILIPIYLLSLLVNAQDMFRIYDEEFNNNSFEWNLKENIKIENSTLLLDNTKFNKPLEITNSFTLNTTDGYKIVSKINKVNGKPSQGFGLIFGKKDNDNYYEFIINSNGFIGIKRVRNSKTLTIKPYRITKNIVNKAGEANTFKIVNTGRTTIFYLNEIKVYNTNSVKIIGDQIGFKVYGKQKIAINSLKISTGEKAYANYYSSLQYSEKNEWENAQINIEKAVQLEPKNDVYRAQLIFVYYSLINKQYIPNKDYANTIKYSNKITSLFPDQEMPYHNIYNIRATAYAQSDNYSKALEDINTLIDKQPKDHKLYYKRALIMKKQGNIIGFQQNIYELKKMGASLDELNSTNDPLLVYLTGSTVVIKKNKGFNNQLPPILAIKDISFSENILDAEETAKLTISLENVGPGIAKDVLVKLNGELQGLSFTKEMIIPSIPASGGQETVTIDIIGNKDLVSSQAIIKIEVTEPNFKVRIQGKQVKFPTRSFQAPELILAQYAVVENQSANPNNQIDINEMIDLKLAVQNIGVGDAKNVSLKIENNQAGVMLLGVVKDNKLIRTFPSFDEIKSGKYETIICRYFVNSEFTDDQLEFSINSSEKVGAHGFIINKSFPINKQLEEEGYIRNIAKDDIKINSGVIIEDIPDFVIDVDTDIPVNKIIQPKTYALIIGNEDYKSKQIGLREEQNVDYAINDAKVFSQYCTKTLGIPYKQVKLLKNATAAEIGRGISWLKNLAKLEQGEAEIILYYSGHGLPHETTKEAYIIPVDVSGESLDYAIKLSDIYKSLTKYNTKKTTVFLDACFSGGARNEGLLAMKSIRIKPKENIINGNLVVFSSSSGDESSNIYRNKHHGYFTYFLLKKLKETKGNVSYEDLNSYIIKSVSKETVLNGKIQTPQLNVGMQIEKEWKEYKIINLDENIIKESSPLELNNNKQ